MGGTRPKGSTSRATRASSRQAQHDFAAQEEAYNAAKLARKASDWTPDARYPVLTEFGKVLPEEEGKHT